MRYFKAAIRKLSPKTDRRVFKEKSQYRILKEKTEQNESIFYDSWSSNGEDTSDDEERGAFELLADEGAH